MSTQTHKKIDVAISDLFFNTEHQFDQSIREFSALDEEAHNFLGALDRLGVETPTAEDLLADFYARL